MTKTKTLCSTCEEPVNIWSSGKCTNCWEVERRLEDYASSLAGRVFIAAVLARALASDST